MERTNKPNVYCGCGNHDVTGRLNHDAYDALRQHYADEVYEGLTKDQMCDFELDEHAFECGMWDYPDYLEVIESHGATCDPACAAYR